MRFFKCLPVLVFVAGCGDLSATREDSDAIREHSRKLVELSKETTHGIHLEILSSALKNMLDNGLSPPLVALYADAYAKEATPKELLDTVDLLVRNFKEKLSLKSYICAQVLSGIIPEGKFQAILQSQEPGKNTGGAQQRAALRLTGLRYVFMRDVLLDGTLKDEQWFAVESLEKGVEALSRMKGILRLPYVKYVEVLNPLSAKIDPEDPKTLGAKLKTLATKKLDVNSPRVKKLLSEI